MVKFKILHKNENCLLLQYIGERRYMVRDIENEAIYIGYNYDNAESIFEKYDIEEVRKQRKELLDTWIKEFVEA